MTTVQEITNQSKTTLLSHQTPLHIEVVSLIVKNLSSVSQFYQNIIGLAVISEAENEVMLGTSEAGFLRLTLDLSAREQSNRMSGLFHTAFLVPTRLALAHWLHNAQAKHAHIDGASDHGVSEAFYLSDPEGNGIEVYVDRPRSEWIWQNGRVSMGNMRIDMRGLLELASKSQKNAVAFKLAAGSRIGHVHLRVPELEQARAFFKTPLGFDETCAFPGALFFSNGGYHHHIAANTWGSDGGEHWQSGYLGLAKVTLAASSLDERLKAISRWKSAGAEEYGHETVIVAPWGTAFALE
jgi:catechol 2,3-dioxygenase